MIVCTMITYSMQFQECFPTDRHTTMVEGHGGALSRSRWPVCVGVGCVGQQSSNLAKNDEI